MIKDIYILFISIFIQKTFLRLFFAFNSCLKLKQKNYNKLNYVTDHNYTLLCSLL